MFTVLVIKFQVLADWFIDQIEYQTQQYTPSVVVFMSPNFQLWW